MSINIIQDGKDGFGHQLHGLFTCLVVHNVINYYFDGFEYIQKKFIYQHVNKDESENLKNYVIEIINQFNKEYNIIKKEYTHKIHAHAIDNIPKDYNDKTLYSLDNIFKFDKYSFNYGNHVVKPKDNLEKIKKLFINKLLPQSKLVNNHIVIHIRLGDALYADKGKPGFRGDKIIENNQRLIELIDILNIKYTDHHYYIHSDGDVDWLLKKIKGNVTFYNKKTPVIDVLSDFINSKILICGISSLSYVSSFLGNKELVIFPDNINCSKPIENTYSISDYISSNSKIL